MTTLRKIYRYWDEHGVYRQFRYESKAELARFKRALAERKARPQEERRQGLLWQDWVSTWLELYISVERVSGQMRKVTQTLDHYLQPRFGLRPITELTEADLLSLRKHLAHEHLARGSRLGSPKFLAPKTVNHVLALAKQIMRAAAKRGLVAKDPWETVKLLKVSDKTMLYWTADQRDTWLRVWRPLEPEFARLVTVAAHTGLRLSELRGLRRAQLDFQRKLIEVSAVEDETGKREERTKNGSLGYVPMNAECFAGLRHLQLAKGDERVFDTHIFKTACKDLKNTARAAGVPAIRFHDLRHTFASCLVMAGVDLYTVQKLMRHKTIQMTMRYAHLAPAHLSDAVAKIESYTRSKRDLYAGIREPMREAEQPAENTEGASAPRGT
jgi:integrase